VGAQVTMMKVCMPDIRSEHTAARRHLNAHRGLTLTELIVAIALFTLVLGLLGFPLFAAFGYIQKAIAQSEAAAAGQKVTKELRREIENAEYLFPIPPGGESINFIPQDDNDSWTLGNYANASAVSVVRYTRVLDFPWVWDKTADAWSPLFPNDSEAAAQDRYDRYHFAFYSKNTDSQRANPYVLARYQEGDLSFGSATMIALDGSYPMDQGDYQMLMGSERNQGLLLRKMRDDMVAMTPYGPDWDVSHFTVRPMRVATEALQRSETGSAVCTSLFSHYPLWAARSRDLDEYGSSLLQTFYYPLVDTAAPDSLADLRQFVDTEFPLYRLYPDTANGPITATRNWRNPFGYQIRVYNDDGQVAFGMYFDKTATPPAYQAICNRHYMEWPPIDRPDLASPDGAGYTFDLSVAEVAQWRNDVRRQRAAGQVVFEQPYAPQNMALVEDAGSYYLPIPGGNWQSDLTYRVKPPQRITVAGTTYKLVDKDPGDFKISDGNVFCLKYRIRGLDTARKHGEAIEIGSYDWCRRSREIVINNPPSSPVLITASYTICDLQPTDTVVATYSTQGMIDLALTLSRRDRSGAKLDTARQNFTVNLRVEARNAMRRARRSE